MRNSQFNDCRPSKLEEQAYAEARNQFAESLKQFPTSRDAIRKLEGNLATMALAMNMAAARPSSESVIQTDDGLQWHKDAVLFDNIFVCHRRTDTGVEYAVVEQFSNGSNEIRTKGWNAVEVLRVFTWEQKHALQVWTEDLNAQVRLFLAEKYPGQDMSRVADGFMRRFADTERLQPRQTQSRGIRIGDEQQ